MTFNLRPSDPILLSCELVDAAPDLDQKSGRIHVIGQQIDQDRKNEALTGAPEWQRSQWQHEKNTKPIFEFATDQGPLWILECDKLGSPLSHTKEAGRSPQSMARDLVGMWIEKFFNHQIEDLHLELSHADAEEQLGALLGLELGFYRYRAEGESGLTTQAPRITVSGCSQDLISEGANLGYATNLARHLVNLPAATLNPSSYAQLIVGLLGSSPHCHVDVWEEERLQSENMGLMLAVGQAAEHRSRMVHVRYRPPGCDDVPPIALVGKGITFDSGGLDIKPSSGMRLMKKDMGGSAAVVGAVHWLVQSDIKQPCDAYIALAENAIDERSFRPGDILKSRRGLTVEITNTDAEGRLVMADALDVAATQKDRDEPSLIIDVATLTGAIKVGLGTELAGMFSNDDDLASALSKAAFASGDRVWRLPLLPEYEESMGTNVADIVNAGSSRFGGAITAALFLQKFVGQKSWAHLDIYAWNDRPRGGCAESGGSGQGVQLLAKFFSEKTKKRA